MPFQPSKKSYILLFSFLVFFLFLDFLYTQIPKSTLYYWFTLWDRYRNFAGKTFTYTIPLISRHYIIQSGDSFWSIAKRFNLNIDTIVSFNEVPRVHVIPENYQVKIPFQDGIMVSRSEGQSLEDLKSSYNVAEQSILFFNPDFYKSSNVYLPGVLYNLEVRLGKLGSEFFKPLKQVYLTSLFGLRVHPITKKRRFHYGVDIRGNPGETVYSAKGGRVTFAGEAAGFGTMVVVVHNRGYISRYAHLSRALVKSGMKISSQHPIGLVGKTGKSTGYHLHFEIWKNGKPIDPRDVTDFY